MFKKIVGIIVYLVLFVGSICGLVYGIKYHNIDNEQAQTIARQEDKIETLEKQLKQLMEEKQKIIADNMISIEEKNAKIAELESKQEQLENEIAKLLEGATSDYAVVKYYIDNELYDHKIALKGSNLIFPTIKTETEEKIYKWKIKDSEIYVDNTFEIEGNVSLVGELQGTWTTISGNVTLANLNGDETFTENVQGLKANTQFRVTIALIYYSEETLLFSDNTCLPGKDSGKKDKPAWGTYTNEQTLTWTGELWTMDYGKMGTATITISSSCETDDVLTINYVCNHADNKMQRLVSISKIEIFN